MLNTIKNFMIRLREANFRILWFELLLLSVILGGPLHSWPVACLILLGLSWILNRQKGALYMVFVLSFCWGLIAMAIVYCFSGWGWAAAWGVFILVCGIGIHFRDLKQPLYDIKSIEDAKELQWKSNCYFGRQNLN